MRSSARLLPVLAAAVVAAGVPATTASAAQGVVTDVLGSVVVSASPSLDAQLSGNCTYTRAGAGVGGGSVSFQVAAEGTALGTYKGVEIVATSVSCDLVKRTYTLRTGTQWFPGSAAVATVDDSTLDVSVLAVCIEVQAGLRHVPIGESDNLITTGPVCKEA